VIRRRWFQGVWVSQGRQVSPVFPFAEVEVLPCEHAVAPQSWRGKRYSRLSRFRRSCRVYASSRIAIAVPVGRRGDGTMIARRPEVVPAERANEVVARGQCHGPTRWFRGEDGEQPGFCLGGLAAGAGRADCAEQALPRARSVPGCAPRSWSRPPWCLQVSSRSCQGGLGSCRVRRWLPCARAPEARAGVVARGRVASSSPPRRAGSWRWQKKTRARSGCARRSWPPQPNSAV